jgi:hypothetical protein
MSDENIPTLPERKLTSKEILENRFCMIHEIDDYIQETIQLCDSPEDLIALGSVLQVMSKNILTSVLQKREWAESITQYTLDVIEEPDVPRKKWGRIEVDDYKGKFF